MANEIRNAFSGAFPNGSNVAKGDVRSAGQIVQDEFDGLDARVTNQNDIIAETRDDVSVLDGQVEQLNDRFVDYDDEEGFGGIVGQNGRSPIAIHRNGDIKLGSGALGAAPPEDDNPVLALVAGVDNRMALGVDKRTGGMLLRLAAASRRQLAADLGSDGLGGSALNPSAVRATLGFAAPYNVFQRGLGVSFTANLDGVPQGFLARRDLVSSPTAIEDVAGNFVFLLHEGDSKSVGGSGAASGQDVVSFTPPYPYNALTFNVGSRPQVGAYVLDPSSLVDLVPAKEVTVALGAGYSETPGTSAMRWLVERQGAPGGRRGAYGYCSTGQAGTRTSQIGATTQPFANGTVALNAAAAIIAKYGASFEIHEFLQCGTNDRTQTAATTIQSLLDAHLTARRGQIIALTGKPSTPPAFIFLQPEAPADNTGPGVQPLNDPAIGILGLTEARPDAILAGPKYWYKDEFGFVDESGSADLHNKNKGYALDGEQYAEALRACQEAWRAQDEQGLDRSAPGVIWKGFRPKAVTRAAAAITVEFHPENIVAPLVLDATWLPNAGNFGFTAKRASDQSALTISSVALGAFPRVVVTLSADPGAPVQLDYCWSPGPGSGGSLRSGTWGNLRDSAAIPSNVTPAGTRPHWALAFKSVTPT